MFRRARQAVPMLPPGCIGPACGRALRPAAEQQPRSSPESRCHAVGLPWATSLPATRSATIAILKTRLRYVTSRLSCEGRHGIRYHSVAWFIHARQATWSPFPPLTRLARASVWPLERSCNTVPTRPPLEVDEMQVLARACGHQHLDQFERDDITTWKREIADLTGIEFAGYRSDRCSRAASQPMNSSWVSP